MIKRWVEIAMVALLLAAEIAAAGQERADTLETARVTSSRAVSVMPATDTVSA